MTESEQEVWLVKAECAQAAASILSAYADFDRRYGGFSNLRDIAVATSMSLLKAAS